MSVDATPCELLDLGQGDDGVARIRRNHHVTALGSAMSILKDLSKNTPHPGFSEEPDFKLQNKNDGLI